MLVSTYLQKDCAMKNTRMKIINAAKDLFSKKGYSAAATKEIALCAGISEVTLFRHFNSKRELFESVIAENVKMIDGEDVFHKKITHDLRTDLMSIATQMHMVYQANAAIIMMIMKDVIGKSEQPSPYTTACRGAHMKKHLILYLDNLYKKKKIHDAPEMIAELFISCIHGYLITTIIIENREADEEKLAWMVEKIYSSIQ